MYHNRPLDGSSLDSPLPASEAIVADSTVPNSLREMVENAEAS